MDHCGEDVDDGGGCSPVKLKDTWENSTPASRFCFEPETALKLKVYKGRLSDYTTCTKPRYLERGSWDPKLLWTVTAAMKLKDTCSLKGKL